jgi:hypothetical protein
MSSLFQHKKTGNLYKLLHRGVDTTNGRGDPNVAVYSPIDDSSRVFVRDFSEFAEKFFQVDI